MREKVLKSLEKIAKMLGADGGSVELVDIDEEQGLVKVKLLGACMGCPMATMTLKNGIERILKEDVPEVKKVEAVN
ncbi:MAG: NifU family protein [bacterium]|nr:NifU family protein [bacterium]MDD5353659.1 NifU family protein [bacterium]MDD5756490.1 NifU family protein [bacterium]